jgi:hypothetical protein
VYNVGEDGVWVGRGELEGAGEARDSAVSVGVQIAVAEAVGSASVGTGEGRGVDDAAVGADVAGIDGAGSTATRVGKRVNVGGGGRIGSVAVGEGVVGTGLGPALGMTIWSPSPARNPQMPNRTRPMPAASNTRATTSVHRRDKGGISDRASSA